MKRARISGFRKLQAEVFRVRRDRDLSKESWLLGLATSHTSDSIRRSAIVTLYQLRSPQVAPLLRGILASEDENQNIRETAIKTLGEVGSGEDLPLLRQIATFGDRARFGQPAAQKAAARLESRLAVGSASTYRAHATVIAAKRGRDGQKRAPATSTSSKRVDKTVFISYRRDNAAWALAIFQNLTHSGYDVFFDCTGIASGDFERLILENIKARAHFIVLLTPSALVRCGKPGDWLRREIETALETHRNIVPLMLQGFEFETPSSAKHLTGRLAALRRYNGLRVPIDYFDAAMQRLQAEYLNVPLDAVLHPPSLVATQAVKEQQDIANVIPRVTKSKLRRG